MTTTIAALRLDEATHRAFLGDRELIRATTALADVGIIDTRWFTPESAQRGTDLHGAIAQWGEGGLKPSLDLALDPFWAGFDAFLTESRFFCHSSEQAIWDEANGYAGRYDLLGQLPCFAAGDDTLDLLDLKTGHAPRWVGLQTMGYRRLVLAARVRRWALELPGDCTYRLVPLNLRADRLTIDRTKDQQDEAVFLAAVRVARWKRGL
jgi:hypothetical protein